MFLFASKVLPVFVFPLGLAILLLAVTLLAFGFPRLRLLLIHAAFFVLAAFSSHRVSQALLRSLESQTPATDFRALPARDAIVVLSDYVRAPTPAHPDAELIEPSDRLLHAVRLFRAGKAPLILLTGGVVPFLGRGQSPEGPPARALLVEWGVPAAAIQLENESRNTRENAEYTRRMLETKNIRRILLVTSAYHMPRASAVFRKAGFDVIPAPTDYQTGWREPDWLFAWLPDPENLTNSTTALKEWLGLVIYRVRGWA